MTLGTKSESRGILLYAYHNVTINYKILTEYCVENIRKCLPGVPVCLVTDISFEDGLVDFLIPSNNHQENPRNYNDGTISNFKNERLDCFTVSPFEYTLLMDVDYIVRSHALEYLFAPSFDAPFLMGSKAHWSITAKDVPNWMNTHGSQFYWSTLVWFKKSDPQSLFFDLVQHISLNRELYWNLHSISTPLWRNDYAFTLAAAILKIKPNPVVESIACIGDGSFVNKTHPVLVVDDALVINDLHFMNKRQLCNLLDWSRNAKNLVR